MNELHAAFREEKHDEAKLLALISSKPELLQQEDDSWEVRVAIPWRWFFLRSPSGLG